MSVLTYADNKPEELADHIYELCTHTERCKIICNQNARMVREYFSPSSSAKSVITAISDAISTLYPVMHSSYGVEYHLPSSYNNNNSLNSENQ
jgi:hypothetical protein